MNYSEFSKKYQKFKTNESSEPIGQIYGEKFADCIKAIGGISYNEGVYQVFNTEEVQSYTEAANLLFPEYSQKIGVFGCDWLGRLFAVDMRNGIDNDEILMLETGAGEAMQIPVGIEEFHNVDLVQYADDALAFQFYLQWKAENSNETIGLAQCVGYKTPLFLGGSDTLDNLEITDLAVYVNLCGQLRHHTMKLEEGQTINSVGLI